MFARPASHEPPPGLPTPSEMAWALIFAVAKRVGIEDRVIRGGGWQSGFPIPLAGKTLGLLGAGHLGGAMVPVAKALGMDVMAWSQNLTDVRCGELGVEESHQARTAVDSRRPRSVLGLFAKSSRNMLRASDLASMKTGAILVNISRGPIVEEAGLIEALRSGPLAGAGLDVFDRGAHSRRTMHSGRSKTKSSPHTSGMSPNRGSGQLGSAWPRTSSHT